MKTNLPHHFLATDLPSAFGDRKHAGGRQSRCEVAKPVAVACILPPLEYIAQELVLSSEYPLAGRDSLWIEARLVQLEEGRESRLCLCNSGVEDGVGEEADGVHDGEVHGEALHRFPPEVVEDLWVEGGAPGCKVDPTHHLHMP